MSFAFAYARVSTEEQDLDVQVRAVEDWAKANNVIILKWFVDHGVSGATKLQDRPGFKQLVQELNNVSPRPKLLLVYDVTRLARSVSEFILAWSYIENELGLMLVPVRDIHLIRLDPAYRDVFKTLLAALAQLEREFIRRRTRDGMKKAKAEGKILNIVDRLRQSDPDLLDTICREYESGEPKYRIAKRHNLSLYAVERILREYCGHKSELTCPRCMHMLTIERRDLELASEGVRIRIVYYCKNCGFVMEKYET